MEVKQQWDRACKKLIECKMQYVCKISDARPTKQNQPNAMQKISPDR